MPFTVLLPLFLFLLSVGETPADAADQCPFTLTIQEKRFEEVITPGASSTIPANFETNSVVYGHFNVPEQPLGIVHTYTDSIAIDTLEPFPFTTFMSRDTLYHEAQGRSGVIGKRIDALTDSMLQCVFEGPSLKISVDSEEYAKGHTGDGAIVPRNVSHQKPECGSGEYSRLNLPLSLGFFFTGMPKPSAGKDCIWEERKPLPSYSAMHFFPQLNISLRIVNITSEAVTVVLSADTTIQNRHLTMPSGEEIDIIENRIHIGGTIVIDPANGVPSTGELRIDEQISYLRPRMSTTPASKRCSYLLRLKTQ